MISKALVTAWVFFKHIKPLACFRLWNSSYEFINATRVQRDLNPTGVVGYIEDLFDFPVERKNETLTLLSSETSRLYHYALPKRKDFTINGRSSCF